MKTLLFSEDTPGEREKEKEPELLTVKSNRLELHSTLKSDSYVHHPGQTQHVGPANAPLPSTEDIYQFYRGMMATLGPVYYNPEKASSF